MFSNPVIYWPLDDGSQSDRGFPAAGTRVGAAIRRGIEVVKRGEPALIDIISDGR